MRLFIALEPSGGFRLALQYVQEQLRSAGIEGRYLEMDNLHMTLAFIGMWPTAVTDILPAVQEPFSVTLSHVGMFSKARVVWAGIEPSHALEQLAGRVRDRLDAEEIPFDRQPFYPHITLIRKPVPMDEDVLRRIQVPSVSMTVRDVCLYESVHEACGMRYTVIGRSRSD